MMINVDPLCQDNTQLLIYFLVDRSRYHIPFDTIQKKREKHLNLNIERFPKSFFFLNISC